MTLVLVFGLHLKLQKIKKESSRLTSTKRLWGKYSRTVTSKFPRFAMQWICTIQYNKFTVPLKVAVELHSSQGKYRGKINISLLFVISKMLVLHGTAFHKPKM